MERCNHQYRPSLRGGYMCELCEKDIDSETYDEIAQLTAERDRLQEALKEIMDNRADYCTTCAENVDTAVSALYTKEAK